MRGIYHIKCTDNQRTYFGQTGNFSQRRNEHLSKLRRGKHENIHLQRTFNKYGEDSFVIELIEESNSEDLNSLEQSYINSLPWRETFNINKIASKPPSNKGKKQTLEHIGKRVSQMTGDKNPMFGKTHSEETRKKMSNSQKGRTMNDNTRAALMDRLSNDNPMNKEENKIKVSLTRLGLTKEEVFHLVDKWNSYKEIMTVKTFTEKENLNNRRTLAKLIKLKQRIESVAG